MQRSIDEFEPNQPLTSCKNNIQSQTKCEPYLIEVLSC
jgi:hypothetical protein